ncbi:Response regulator consisting of a CheY-like receiver domain and a winged-helix DNA-binding domain(Signal transduction response regulator, receiver domain,1-112；Winged helix-turn-helix transcription repressor DNA-binding,123-219&|uniref:response regulator transcription factor n=1 Tax=Magnetospirillum sp. XM-1 TaxID=1663591 RepID=UPI00073DD17B|nr:response regulator transcription factor [Magnetospirillum sp. XM-1]CUW38246.1 Response regulator consisting of a CheY-like receiver domain and a winged-helix DNA-binding domain(Signal transduction response regulator, receiver domain,1-112\
MRVLVVEDEPQLTLALERALEAAGFAVDTAYDGENGWHLGDTEAYDAVILDLGLPRIDGITVLGRWREAGRSMPVMVLTARARWAEKSQAFNAGADDYVTKPFEMEEVVTRVRALIRRAAGHASPEIVCGPLRIDTIGGKVSRDGLPVALTAQEFRILSYLAHHQGRVVSRSELVEHVYDRDADPDSNVLDVLVARIRRKLGVDVIHTLRGQGWRMEAPGGEA